MKRKLDENDEPIPSPVTKAQSADGAATTAKENDTLGFADLGLDSRLLQACAHLGYQKPTLVQSKSIAAALDGDSVLAKSKTGSGKTAAYLLPVLSSVLKRKQASSTPSTTALILVPTRELADQVFNMLESLSAFCAKEVQAVKLSDSKQSDAVTKSLLATSPDIVITTPARAYHSVKNSTLSLQNITQLVLDEADLVLSYGYEEDIRNLAALIPKNIQAILMSATLTTDVNTVKGVFCQNPIILDLEEAEPEGTGVSQFYTRCAEDEKFLLVYVIYKLRLISGKSIIFVANVDRSYRLKLFLEAFGVRACVLNSELPVTSRIRVVSEFNQGVYDIIIASDENEVLGNEDAAQQEGDEQAENRESAEKPSTADKAPPKKKRKSSSKQLDREYGVSRGIDFKNVGTVINFDLPLNVKSYAHRVGRTARAGQSGMALSFVIPRDKFRKHIPTSVETAANDEKVLARIIKKQGVQGKELKPYVFDMKELDKFRYRMNDALRSITKVAIREARTRELRHELLNSERLKRHFSENPADLYHIRHDHELRAARQQPHLRHVPDYLLPKDGKKALNVGFVPFKKERDGKGRKGKSCKGRGRKVGGRKSDPLRSFKGRSKPK